MYRHNYSSMLSYKISHLLWEHIFHHNSIQQIKNEIGIPVSFFSYFSSLFQRENHGVVCFSSQRERSCAKHISRGTTNLIISNHQYYIIQSVNHVCLLCQGLSLEGLRILDYAPKYRRWLICG